MDNNTTNTNGQNAIQDGVLSEEFSRSSIQLFSEVQRPMVMHPSAHGCVDAGFCDGPSCEEE